MFIDHAKIYVKGGRGGNGCISFRKEKYVPRGGPDGGNGGNGGSVILEASKSVSNLNAFRFHQHFKAERGRHGKGKRMDGSSGEDLIVMLPPGTQVYDADKISLLADLQEEGDRFIAAKGGRGGKGNASFATSTNRAPKYAESGREGEEFYLILELKLIADVGLIGYPNVGKSTLISKISSAHPKIADYPFTTLTPHLGVVSVGSHGYYDSFVVADIPGLIEGAHEGHGLGDRFLQHVERTRLLLHMVDMSDLPDREPVKDVRIINRELRKYSPSLRRKPQIIVASKIDVLQNKDKMNRLKKYCSEKKLDLIPISSITGEGLNTLLKTTLKRLKEI
ncbi:MAG: GTPase ObgE [Acidobacteriota bacterium]